MSCLNFHTSLLSSSGCELPLEALPTSPVLEVDSMLGDIDLFNTLERGMPACAVAAPLPLVKTTPEVSAVSQVEWGSNEVRRLLQLKKRGYTNEKITSLLNAEWKVCLTAHAVQKAWQNFKPNTLKTEPVKKARILESAPSTEKGVVWTPAVKEELIQLKAKDFSIEDIREALNAKFGLTLTSTAVRSAWTAFGPSELKISRLKWTIEMKRRFFELKAEKKTHEVIKNVLNVEFGIALTKAAVDRASIAYTSSDLEEKEPKWTGAHKARLIQLRAERKTYADIKEIFYTEFGVDVSDSTLHRLLLRMRFR